MKKIMEYIFFNYLEKRTEYRKLAFEQVNIFMSKNSYLYMIIIIIIIYLFINI